MTNAAGSLDVAYRKKRLLRGRLRLVRLFHLGRDPLTAMADRAAPVLVMVGNVRINALKRAPCLREVSHASRRMTCAAVLRSVSLRCPELVRVRLRICGFRRFFLTEALSRCEQEQTSYSDSSKTRELSPGDRPQLWRSQPVIAHARSAFFHGAPALVIR